MELDCRTLARALTEGRLLCCPAKLCCRCGIAILRASIAGFLSPLSGRPGLVPIRGALRPRCSLRAYSHAALAVDHNRLRPATSAATRAWQSTGLTLARSVLGAWPGVAAAAELLGQALAPSNAASYQRLWTLFERFCESAQRSALPASPATVCADLGTLFKGRRLRGTSIRPYIARIGTHHRRLALADSMSHTLVVMARRGLAAADARRRTGAPPRSAAYPVDAALQCLYAALRAPTSLRLRYWATVAVGFLISARPVSVVGLTLMLCVCRPTPSSWSSVSLDMARLATPPGYLFAFIPGASPTPYAGFTACYSLLLLAPHLRGFALATFLPPLRLACVRWAPLRPRALAILPDLSGAEVSAPRTRLAFPWNALCAWATTRLPPLSCGTIWIPSCRRRPLPGFSLVGSFPLRALSLGRFHRSRFLLAIRSRPLSPLCCRVTFRNL
jgi:hypothetical protein